MVCFWLYGQENDSERIYFSSKKKDSPDCRFFVIYKDPFSLRFNKQTEASVASCSCSYDAIYCYSEFTIPTQGIKETSKLKDPVDYTLLFSVHHFVNNNFQAFTYLSKLLFKFENSAHMQFCSSDVLPSKKHRNSCHEFQVGVFLLRIKS